MVVLWPYGWKVTGSNLDRQKLTFGRRLEEKHPFLLNFSQELQVRGVEFICTNFVCVSTFYTHL